MYHIIVLAMLCISIDLSKFHIHVYIHVKCIFLLLMAAIFHIIVNNESTSICIDRTLRPCAWRNTMKEHFQHETCSVIAHQCDIHNLYPL